MSNSRFSFYAKKLFFILTLFLISCSSQKLKEYPWCEDVFIPNNKYYKINVERQEGFEIPPVQKASSFLPKSMLESKVYKIKEDVYSDGIIDHFEVTSKWGNVKAAGFLVLKSKLNQINALDTLDKVEQTPFFEGVWNAMVGLAMSPINLWKAAASFFEDDSKKVEQYSQEERDRLQVILDKQKEYAKNGNDESDDDITNTRFQKIQDSDKNYVSHVLYENEEIDDLSTIESVVGVKKYAMEIMQQFNIDPDHTNEVLRDKILSIARMKAAGGLTTSLIPASPVLTILSSASTAAGTANSIYNYSNIQANIKSIREGLLLAGCSEKLIQRFQDAKGFSNFLKSIIAMNVVHLRHIQNISELIKIATLIDDVEIGWIYMNVAALLPSVANEEHIVRLIKNAPLLIGVTADNRVIILFAGDHLYWTKDTNTLFKESLESIKEDGIKPYAIEARIKGIMSTRFKNELSNLGVKIKKVDNVEYSIKIYNE